MKRLISLFTAIVMVLSMFSCLSFNAYADDGLIRGDFQSGKKKFIGEQGYCYSDKYFTENDATVYNPSLATMSCCLAFASYHAPNMTYETAYDVLNNCGFNEIGIKHYNYTTPSQPDGIACILGAKTLGTKTLIDVTVRGSGYDTEWASNVNLGESGVHYGFDLSGQKVVNYLRNYIAEKGITGDVIIWLNGFSRAGAVAEHAAARLNKTAIDGVSFNKSSIYAYCFAVPNGADASDNTIHSDAYNNIFNIVEFNDPISLFAPLKWGFDRYGITYVLPSRESINADTYSEYVALLKAKLGVNYGLDSHIGWRFVTQSTDTAPYIETKLIKDKAIKDTVGTFNRKGFNLIADSVGTRKNYIDNYEAELMEMLVSLFGSGDTDWNLVVKLLNQLLTAIGYDSPSVSMSVLLNIISVIHVHANQRYYTYWLQSMDPNYNNNLPVKFSYSTYRALIVNGNVDIKVTDEKGRTAAEIKKEMPSDIEDGALVSTLDENHNKVVFLPVDSSYEVEITANAETELTAKIEEYNTFFGVGIREYGISKEKLSKGEKVTSSISKLSDEELNKTYSEPSTCGYSFVKNSNVISPSLDVSGINNVKNKEYRVNVTCDKNKGTVYGGGCVTEGTAVMLQEEPKNGYKFDGFYADGVKITDENLDNNQYSVMFLPSGDTLVEARFSVCNHSNVVKKVKPATTAAAGSHIEYCADCKKELKNYAIPKIASQKINKAKFVYNGKKQVPSVTVKTSDGKKLAANKDYKISSEKSVKSGKYQLQVKYIGDYSGTAKFNYIINPKGTSLKKLIPKKEKAIIKWTKQPKDITGYQVCYSLKKSFKGSKSVTVKGAKKTKTVIKKLKSNKKYYVRIRTYKKIKGKYYYSKWSKVKTVTVK